MFGVVEVSLPFPLIAAGEQHVASSLAAIIVAAAPLFVALLAFRFDAEERATGARLVGLLVGLAGVVALVGIDVGGHSDELLGALAILTAAFCYAVGPMVLKRHLADLDPRGVHGRGAGCRGAGVDAGRAGLAAVLGADRLGARRPRSARAVLHRRRVRVLRRAGGRSRPGPRAGHHLRRAGRGVGVGRGGARRAPGAGAVVGLLLILAGSWLSTDGRLPPGLAALVGPLRRRSGSPPAPGQGVADCAG